MGTSEKAMAPHSSTLAWKIAWTEEPDGLQSMGSLRVGHNWATSLSLSRIGGGNGNPLQCSCLENPRDRGVWWLPSMGSHRVRHDWSDLAAAAGELVLINYHNMLIGYVAAAAKSLQLCPTLCNSIDGSPPGSTVPGILQARTLEWVAISFSNAWKWKDYSTK